MGRVILERDSLEQTRERRSAVQEGVTCVAFFQKRRPVAFDALIDWFWSSVHARLCEWLKHDWVRLTPREQIHATLIGIEARAFGGELFQKNMLARRKGREARPIDLDGFSGYLQRLELPIPLRFGGFSPKTINPYDTRPPFERSFTIRPDGLIVVIGWPHSDGAIRPALFDFRKRAEGFQIVHKYHLDETDCDNDAFFVLGSVTPKPWNEQDQSRSRFDAFLGALSEAQQQIRESLGAATFDVPLTQEHCSIVKYYTADLAGVQETAVLGLKAVTADRLRALFSFH
jgi:hypothetical protein